MELSRRPSRVLDTNQHQWSKKSFFDFNTFEFSSSNRNFSSDSNHRQLFLIRSKKLTFRVNQNEDEAVRKIFQDADYQVRPLSARKIDLVTK